MSEPRIHHQCGVWEFKPGRQRDCRYCNDTNSARYVIPPSKPKPKPRYTYEEAIERIDICAGCGDRISEDSRHHHCERCLPAWLERIAKINAQQERQGGY